MIHVLNFEDKIIDYISKRDPSIVTAEHSHNIEEDTETFELTLHSDKAENLRRRVKLVVEMLDGTYREFFVSEIEDNVVEKETTLTCVASYLEDLSKAKPIPPQAITKQTLIEMLDFGLRGTGWDRGNVDYMGEKSRSWTSYATPYEYLKMLRTTFGHEYRFVIEIEGRKVKRRRVDCVKPEPLFNGREIVYGKDLLGMTRSIDMSEVVTAYIGLGPEKDNGEREVVEVVDDEAQESFDLPENYLWGIYEPESEDQDMTKERLTTLTRTALNKAKSRVFSYEVTSLDVKKQFGHELVQIGDIVRIKNRDFKPPIYADGRVIEITSDLIAGRQTYKLGQIKEYDENKLRAYFNSIKSLLTKKVNDDINNMNTIVIDNIQSLEIFERKITKGSEPPLNPVENQLWYDTSNPDVAILREYVNGQWINATAEDVQDIGGFTREQTIYNDLDNTMDNLLAQHTQLQTLYDNLYNSEYLVDDVLKQDYKAKYDDLNAQFLIAKNLFDSLDLEHATIGKLMDVQAAIVEYRNKLQAFYLISQQVDKSISERIKLLQSQYTDEKYNEAMEKVASSINGTWNAETGKLVAEVPNEARLTELRQQIESTYNEELNSAMATLRNETDSKIVNTKNEISATVTKVDEKITGLTIGGRNLFQSYNSNFPNSINKDIISTQAFTGSYWATNLYRPDFLKTVLKAGETYTYSYEIEIIGLSEKEVPAAKRHGVIFYSATNTEENILSYVELEREVGNTYKVSKTFVAPEITDHRFLAYSGFYSDDGTIKYPVSSNLVKISNLKLEKGTKATDWTPAPEDTTNKIATAQANAEAAAKAYADAQDVLRKTEAQAYADGIVTAEEERAINDAKAKLQEAKTYAEQQKQIAIDTANENTNSAIEPITVRTTNNENSIKTLEDQILLTATKEDVTQQLNTELQPIKTDVNDQKAQLQVMSDEISTKVSMNQYSLDQTSIVEQINNAETERTQLANQINDRVTITEYNSGLTQKTNEINTAVNNIKIGGVNMLDGTKDFTNPFNTPNIQKYGEVINGELTSVDFDSVNNRLMWATFYANIAVQPNTDYTISYDAKTKDGITQGVAYTPITRLQDDGSTFTPQQYVATTQTYKNTTNDFQRYSFTFNTGASKRIRLTFTSKDVNSLTNIKKVKLEIGNKATPYEQSPNDVTTAITKARSDAELSAKAYADAQDKLRKTEVQAYADGIVDAEEQRAINDAQQKLAEAKADAQAKAEAAESLAKQHADTQSAVAETNAKTYADGLKQQTDQTLKTYDTRIVQNGREISQRATKEEFNQSRKTLSQVISELTNSTMNGLTYTYDENGSIQSFNVGPNGTSINTSKLTIDAGDVSLKDGVFKVKSVNTNNITIPRDDGGVPSIINGIDKRESAITGTTPPFKQRLSGNVPVFYESGYWLGCLKRTTDQEYLSYDAFYFTHDRRYLSVSVIFLVGQKATTDPNERTVGEFIKLEEFSPPPSIESQYLINEFKGFATTSSEQDGGGRVQYTFVKDLGPPTGLPRQFYFKVKPNAEGVANPLFETSKPYSMAKFQIRKTILYG
ncbi:hypothetical protein NGB74_02425 [Staphylococcus chromogenes]|uniref:phage tail spike protein n=1 Tax=Staphylococcus chromogenes TaxID=46126 RepID=UPI002DBE5587|nr:phage tail spike protein [Staphylococcus chromogenes]MEB7449865.1 hypothetical protein [Staphylococcus chromogenes]